MTDSLARIEETMIGWTAETGEIARSFFRRTGELSFKYGREAITEADERIETLLRERIRESFPDDAVSGEEFGSSGDGGSGRVWHLDPIDGTLNFALGLPVFCTSIALLEGEEILAALVHHPLTEECFTAVRGGGARLDGRRVSVSGRPALGEAVVSMQLQPDGRFVRNEKLLQTLLDRSMKMRRLGTIALEMAYLADGRYDAMVAGRGRPQQVYDVAAGILLVQEAGGTVTDHLGRPWRPGSCDLVASNGAFHDELVGVIAECEGRG